MKSRLLVIFLCSALFTAYGAKAQVSKAWAAEAIPAKIRGNWALPDCRAYEEGLIITKHFYLKSDKDSSRFWPIDSVAKHKDYWILRIEGKERPARIEADGVLKIANLPGPAPQKWPRTWDALGIDSRHEYMGCADIPAILPDPLVRVMQHIDEIESACHDSLSAACAQTLFNAADTNKNKKISPGELKKAGAMLASIAALIENNTVSRDVMDKAIYQSMRESDRINAQRGNKDLTARDFDGFLGRTDSKPLLDALMSVGTLIPGLKP